MTETQGTASRLGMPRSRGALTGVLLVLLAIWGGLIPFIGPYFNFVIGPDKAWTWTAGRMWYEVFPAIATFVGGALILLSANRVTATIGGWLAAAAGAWFVVGHALTPIWNAANLGVPYGGPTRASLENISMLIGLGAAIVFLAAFALGRSSVVGVRAVRGRDAVDDAAAADASYPPAGRRRTVRITDAPAPTETDATARTTTDF